MAFQSLLCRQMLARYHSCGTAARHLTRTPSFSRAGSAWVQWCLVAPFLVLLIGLWARCRSGPAVCVHFEQPQQ